MLIVNLDKFVYVGEDTIVCTKSGVNDENTLKLKYKIDKENKEIRLYEVPHILDMQEKSLIFYALLDTYYFSLNNEYEDIENYVVKENGYSYHEFNGIDGKSNGILGELLFEIPRQEIESEKLSRLRDIYDMLIRNKKTLGNEPICIAFNGIMKDFKDLLKVIKYMFEYDEILKKKKDKIILVKRKGFLGGNKRIYIIPTKIFHEVDTKKNKEAVEE